MKGGANIYQKSQKEDRLALVFNHLAKVSNQQAFAIVLKHSHPDLQDAF